MGIFQRSRKDRKTASKNDYPTSSGPKEQKQKVSDSENDASADENIMKPAENPRKATENTADRKTSEKIFYEMDNKGRRISRSAEAEFVRRNRERASGPSAFLSYIFNSEIDTLDALLSVSVIHHAFDTGNLICTLPLDFGYFRREDGQYEAVIAGENLSRKLFSQTREFFSLKGRPGNQVRPTGKKQFEKMCFVRQYSEIALTDTCLYQEYTGPDAVSAKSFLNDPARRITRKNHFVLVKTPDGDFYRDYFGIHTVGEK